MSKKNVLLDDNGIMLSRNNNIYMLIMGRGQNLVNNELVSSLNKALDMLEQQQQHSKALIITAKGKFFSNGLDLDALSNAMIEGFWKVLARILVMDCRTVAAINGHAFGAGLFLALACDYRVMRTQRGYINWPELNLGMPLSIGFAELTKAKVKSHRVLREGVLAGKRYDSADALEAGLVDKECPVEELLHCAQSLAIEGLPESLHITNFNPDSFRQMKIELYSDAYRSLTTHKVDTHPTSRL
eukprot:CAMPEP_0194221778 /NCGR_PEP_ID=MMETSP0156-20130528/31335_1 /TAXON_ID=33649 /ORGANISM="Thalassionema nitzschioides, Strain L26-B" /LENGTH=242 /DNA_ID=CAMNT_0038952303 /DNA_START=85 /DNA_END=813 /DNA_ORIENTATION=+